MILFMMYEMLKFVFLPTPILPISYRPSDKKSDANKNTLDSADCHKYK